MSTETLLNRVSELLSPEVYALLEQIGSAAGCRGTQAYLIGGVVRDLMLGIASVDLDIMVESDAGEFAKCVAHVWPEQFAQFPPVRKPVLFKKYKTAKLLFSETLDPGIRQLDFSSARSEHYPSPGANPVVSPGTLESDIARRDFSINAMALSLSSNSTRAKGSLIAPFDGRGDLGAKVIRILHDLSFVDDPARLLRAVRFSTRFGFELEPKTRSLFEAAVSAGCLATLPPGRLFDEFRKSLDEPNWRTVIVLDRAGILAQIEPRMAGFDAARFEQLNAASAHVQTGAHWQRMLGLLGALIGTEAVEDCMSRYGRPETEVAQVTDIAERIRSVSDVY